MALSPTHLEILKKLYNISDEIFKVYINLSEMELSLNKDGFNRELRYLRLLVTEEKNILSAVGNDSNVLFAIVDFLNKEDYSNNMFINERMVSKISNLLFYQKFKSLVFKKNLNFEENIEKGNLLMIEMMDAFTNDIKKISMAYLNKAISNTSNQVILKSFIDYKYKSLFLFLDSDLDLENYLNIDEILLSYEAFADAICLPQMIRNIKIKDELVKQMNTHINNLLNMSDEDLKSDEVMAQALIITFYIKSCLHFLDDISKRKVLDDIKEKVLSSFSRQILIDSIEDSFNNSLGLAFKTVRLKTK